MPTEEGRRERPGGRGRERAYEGKQAKERQNAKREVWKPIV